MAWCFCWEGHWLGFGGFSAESNIVVNEGLLGFGPNSRGTQRARCFPLPGLSIVRDEEMVRHGSGADKASRERGVIKASGCSYFDASTTSVGGWAVAGAKRLRNNGLRVFMLMSPFDVSSNEIDTRC